MSTLSKTGRRNHNQADAEMPTNVGVYSSRLGRVLSHEAKPFIHDRIASAAKALGGDAGERLEHEEAYVRVRVEDGTTSTTSKNYVKVRIVYGADESTIRIPTSSNNGMVRVVADKYMPVVGFVDGPKAAMAGLLKTCAADLAESVLSSSRTRIAPEDYGNAVVFMVPVPRLVRLPGVQFDADVALAEIADRTGFPRYRIQEVRDALAVAREGAAFKYVSKSEERILAAAILYVERNLIKNYSDPRGELNRYTALLAKRLDIKPAQAESALEELTILMNSKRA
ncbi:MAG: hypothetical protein KGI04_04455 [Candidatus Micrarchaeota archaeon]|nr:hypothetical protein [Candidatus Micrarchaeota archaeon]